jgi:menaquinone-specific isochorismate synthase
MVLKVATRELPVSDFRLINHLPKNASVYLRGGSGLVGWGEAIRLTASGPDRMKSLADQWMQISGEAQIENPLSISGTGLVAFGSFAFSDQSSAESVLIVPQVVLGARDGRVWLTEIEGGQKQASEDFWSTEQSYPVGHANLREGEFSSVDFKASVAASTQKINDGKLNKVVLARDLVADLVADFDIRYALKKFSELYETCWIYSVDGTFGASPELLVRVSHGQVSARVLAGTAGRGTDPGVDLAISAALAESSKNLEEHRYAVDSLVSALQPFCTQVDADSKPFSLPLPNVWHLASDVHGVLKQDSSAIDLAAALHPTAAVAGTPKNAALDLIIELEPIDRGRYAGPVGWIGADGDGEWAIALRGGQLSEGKIRAFAGCGIVADSDPAAELAETELKFEPIRAALQ